MNERPTEVTVVGVLVVVLGVLGVVYALMGFLSGATPGLGIAALTISLLIGLVYLLVAKGLFNGNNMSRLIVAIVSGIGVVAGFLALFVSPGSGVVQIVWSGVILALLFTARVRAFFAGSYPRV